MFSVIYLYENITEMSGNGVKINADSVLKSTCRNSYIKVSVL